MEVDVVIPSWNKAELLASCLDHLARQTIPHRVIVADNGSQDGTVAMVRERFPDVKLVELNENVGFGRAVNRAAEAGDGEAIVVLNNDVNPEPPFLAELVAPLAGDDGVGMVSGVLLDPATGLIDAAGVEVDGGLAGYAYMGGLAASELRHPSPGLLGPCGGAAAYRRRAFESLGGFDERIFVYSEDLELALRMRADGWRCELAPGARGMHLGSATLGARSVAQVRLAAWSRGYVLGRYRVGLSWLLMEIGVTMVDLLVLRSAAPLERVRGWRVGRSLSRRPISEESVSPSLGRLSGLRRRLRAARR